uniref:Uncharacterized protein n=2 Tax=Caenorhabditis japonica TaxID=281687 RepID=A0A8R1ICR3_CAEJA
MFCYERPETLKFAFKLLYFSLREEGSDQSSREVAEVEEGAAMGIHVNGNALDRVNFSDGNERPARLTRADSNFSISENDSENESTTGIDKTPESAETTWMRDKKAKDADRTVNADLNCVFMSQVD